MANKNILLIEPGYKNKYPPLGLMKIAAYHGPYGKKDNVKFIKGEKDVSVLQTNWDRIYITTLFSFEWKTIARSIDFALEVAHGDTSKVLVGGIAASLMHERFMSESRWGGIRFIKGLLSEAPALSLQLDDFEEELYSDDVDGTPIEDLIPDYSILDQISDEYSYPVIDAYFAYASRGCVRKCHFCGVPKLEGGQRDAQSITALIKGIDERHGPKRDLTLMDNNVVASHNYREIIAEIRDLGFTPGAKFSRPGKPSVQRRVDFNQGVDARILCRDPMYLREMSTICIKPLRIAFDHLGVRKPYETAIRMAHDVGLHDLSNYMLYNFKDTPADLYERMRLNIDLNEELGIRIFSFPMRFQPTDMPDRSHIGEQWSRYQLRSMQLILQATHGVVSGSPEFFRAAFGETADDYEALLLRPQHFIFNRQWYEEHDGRPEFDEFSQLFDELTLGGTELKDIHPVYYMAKGELRASYSYVDVAKHYTAALEKKALLEASGIEIEVINDSIYNYERTLDKPHLFYLDFCGRFAFSDHHLKIGKMLLDEKIKEGDTLIITSYMGRNPGWGTIFDEYDSEYAILGITTDDEKKAIFRRAHPSMTLYRALTHFRLATELKISCFGCIKYTDSSPMGLFGYQVEEGETSLSSLVHGSNTTYFDSKSGYLSSPDGF